MSNENLRQKLSELNQQYKQVRSEKESLEKKFIEIIKEINYIEWQIQYNDLPQSCKNRECHYTCDICHLIIRDE